MKKEYKKSLSLKCIACGDTCFDFNKDKSLAKCERCEKEYHGGYDELVRLNETEIDDKLFEIKKDVIEDVKTDLNKALKNAFKGNKNIKFK